MFFKRLLPLIVCCSCKLSLFGQAERELQLFIQNNKIPDNIRLSCKYVELENNQWRLCERKTLLWDFKNQRLQIESLALGSDEVKHLAYQKTVLENGKLLGNTEWFSQRTKDLTLKMVLAGEQWHEEIKKLKRGRISSRILMFDFGKIDNFYANYFFSWDGLLFTQALERGIQGGISASLNPLKDSTELVLSKKDKPTIVYSFDTATGMIKSRSVLKKDLSGTNSKKEHCAIVKTKRIDNYNIPTEMHVDFQRSGIGKIVKCRIIVDEESIRINQELKESDFKLKIPVGSEVRDLPKGIFYVSDGVTGDPEIHEHLEDSLEEVLREAEKQRK